MFKFIRSVFFICATFVFIHDVYGSNDAYASESRPLVVLITAANGVDDALWFKGIDEYSKSAALAFDMNFEHMFAGTVRPEILSSVKKRLSSEPKPDYLIFGNQRGLGIDLLKLAEASKVKTFLYIAPLLDEDYEQLGGPRSELKYWIGQLMPDDEQAGYDLANILIDNAKKKKSARGDETRVKLVGITGRRSTTSSFQRQRGLMRALKDRNDVTFLQSVTGRWLGEVAAEKYKGLKRRYDEIDAVWCANDPMAIGVIEASKAEANPPSIGGVDWIPPALTAVSQDELVTTMGGHNFDVAYVVALLKQYHIGNDFAYINKTYSLQSKLVPMTKDSLPYYENFIEQKDLKKIDYVAGFDGLLESENLKNITMQRFIEQSTAHLEGGEG